MKRKYVAVGIILLFVGTSIIPAIAQNTEKSLPASRVSWLYVGGSGPGNYTKIQDAINDSSDGDTIVVYNGTYYEHFTVNKQLVLMGIPSVSGDIPCIDGGEKIPVTITAENCTFETFSVGSDHDFGIFVQSNGNIIRNCRVFKADGDIKLKYASHNLIADNIFHGGVDGILLQNSSYNTIINNTADSHKFRSFTLWSDSNYNIVCNNDFSYSNYWEGISNGENCSYNIYKNNTIWENTEVGIYIESGYGISIIGNSFRNNGIAFSSSVPELLTYTIENNTINDKHIYFYKNQHDVLVPSDAGQLFLLQCSDFTIQNLTISHVRTGYQRIGGGICLINSSRTMIQGTKISSCSPVGIYLIYSDDNTISSNILSNNLYGGLRVERSNRNVVSENVIENGEYNGIILYHASNNTVKRNTISGYPECIELHTSSFNILSENTIMNRLIISGMSDANQVTQNVIQGGVEISYCRSNTFRYNDISNGSTGIFLEGACRSNSFVNNNITHNGIGVLLIGCLLNMFKRNNFLHNDVHAYFEDTLLVSLFPNIWRRNYWDDSVGFSLKRIPGKMIINHLSFNPDPEYQEPPTIITWFNFDWFPAKRPYDIP
jgi:parallel beta-helix repeat protein